jgi:hypothetical protein
MQSPPAATVELGAALTGATGVVAPDAAGVVADAAGVVPDTAGVAVEVLSLPQLARPAVQATTMKMLAHLMFLDFMGQLTFRELVRARSGYQARRAAPESTAIRLINHLDQRAINNTFPQPRAPD